MSQNREFTPEDIDRFYEKQRESRTIHYFTGKQGLINHEIAFMRQGGASEDQIAAAEIRLDKELDNGIYGI